MGIDLCKHNHRYIDTLWDTPGCPPVLFVEGSAAATGNGSNLQHLVAISPRSLAALVQTSKQTTTCHIMSCVSQSIRIYQNLSESIRIYRQWHYHQHDQNKRTKRTTPTTTLPNIKQLHHCTYPFPHPSTSTLHSSSFLLAWQNFTAKKSQHLQSGFRLLLSLRFFLQALLAICGFFRFCYSCLYGICLDLR